MEKNFKVWVDLKFQIIFEDIEAKNQDKALLEVIKRLEDYNLKASDALITEFEIKEKEREHKL